ncbi:MAG: Phosphatidyl-myo-inositol mannosyltransferase [Cryomorphaceae bacterium]|nr:MAG: Phosphatidyl-myo-inositol mannosyltransferase [Cryomorphaceae bacterium]|tara:strand:- start:1949 stop:3106 length:1158 start_codon:yes stop_codon:yes gene_type:complete
MRICLVSSSFYPATFYGGPISATWDLSKKLAENGHEIYVSTTNANGDRKLSLECNYFLEKENNVFVKYYNEQITNKFSLSFLFGIWSDIKKSDIVYIQYLFHYTVLFSLLFSVIQKKKIVVCPRGSFSFFTLNNKLPFIKLLWLNFFIKPMVDKIIWQASSYLEERDVLKKFPNADVKIINDGIDYESFQNSITVSRYELLNKFTGITFNDVSNIFFSMGRLHKIKSFDVLIDAFNLFLQKDKYAKLIIAGGDDGVGKQLQNQIQKFNLGSSVFLIGAINFEDKKLLLNNCDYFTLASEFESFGIVIAEALSCGKPVVISNKTPWKDIQINNCGILANNEKCSFNVAFSKIINEKYDSSLIKNYVKMNYDWAFIVGKFINLIKKK